ncbi:hypothetical protein P7C73_g6549, partial [Tremellales sp. Uapishka_1]
MPRPLRLILLAGVLALIWGVQHLLSATQTTDPLSPSTAPIQASPHIHPISYHPSTHSSSDDITIDSRGLTAFKDGDDKHPIELLIERAKVQERAMEGRIEEIASLEDAVDDYMRGWGMQPPKGFDKWYDFTQLSPSPRTPPLPTLFPLSHNPFLTFLSHPASLLRERVDEVRGKGAIFTFTFVPDGQGDKGTACTEKQAWVPKDWADRGKGRVQIRGTTAWQWRCNNTLTLLLPILPLLPAELFTMDPPLELAFSSDDGPRGMVHSAFREHSEALGKAGKVWPKAQLEKAEQGMRWTYGWQWSCPDDAPLKTQNTDLVLNDLVAGIGGDNGKGPRKTFIADFAKGADYCYNPDLMPLHHILLSERHRAAVEIVPVVATCKTTYNSDVVGVPLDGVYETVDYVPWEEKTLSKRGSATGLSHQKDTLWRQSQRERLHFLTHNTSTSTVPVLADKSPVGGKLGVEEWSRIELNEKWMDVGLSGGPVQCKKEDGSCDEMAKEIDFMTRVRKEDSLKYKFVVDVDGNGWSSRFRRLLSSNNVVLKSTLYPEWFQEMLIPWYHYVPLKLDYSDMYDIMAFFEGSPDGSTPGRDDLAKEIAAQGYDFVRTRWRLEDMQSYMFLLILEVHSSTFDEKAER